MKLILPKEHGAWAMWIAPYVIGVIVGGFKWIHLIMLISIFFAYISISPFLQGIRRRADRKEMWKYSFYYLLIAGILGLPILFNYPGLILILLAIIPFLLINIYYIKKKRERAFLNDIAGIISLSSTIIVAYYIGTKQYDLVIMQAWFLTFLFFLGSVFYVKSAIRERNNNTFKLIAKLYMIFLPLFGFWVSGIYLLLAYLFSTVRILILPFEKNITSMKIGIMEIFNTTWFVIFMVLNFL